jgi:N-acetylglucosamine-6-phosphate deacetylase
MDCSGRNIANGVNVAVTFDDTIREVVACNTPFDTWIAPGWIDLQVNGFAGVDYNSPETTVEDVERSIRALFATGVTRFFPTVITASPDVMAGALRRLALSRERLSCGGAIEGFHVEGPHIAAEDGPRGAHPRHWVRPPDLDEFHRWQEAAEGRVRMVTLSPEWPEAPHYIERIVEEGIVVAIGHTAATTAQIGDAVSAGATVSTHLGNGTHAVLPRHPNYIWDQLAEDRLMAGFIADGIHLDARFLKVALRAKGLERSLLVTDASAPAGAPPGRYRLGEQQVDLTAEGRVVLAGTEKLAGSALSMDRAVENVARMSGLSLPDAVRLATINPAKAAGIQGRGRGLVPGERADMVQFRCHGGRIEVLRTWVGGVKQPF